MNFWKRIFTAEILVMDSVMQHTPIHRDTILFRGEVMKFLKNTFLETT